MVNVIRRMRKLKALLDIRLGPGAAILPPSVTKIHLDCAVKNYYGHSGARKFWRLCLPRLKYHNPAVSMLVTRPRTYGGPATLTIFFDDAGSGGNATTAASGSASADPTVDPGFKGRTAVVDMLNQTESEILRQVVELTGATAVTATKEEQAEIRELEAQGKRSELDMARTARMNEQRKQEKALLEQARGVMA